MTKNSNGRAEKWQVVEDAIVACRNCPRLVTWREGVAQTRKRAYQDEEYWGKAVPGFGDRQGRVMVVGLAPGAHGSNRTGRVFTGDSSGHFLYRALHQAGFANQPESIHRQDGLELNDLYISAVCRCAPPANRPSPAEIATCLPFLERELALLDPLVLVALGQIAFDYLLRIYRERGAAAQPLTFGHGAVYRLGEGLPWLVVSYHPSRQNTQTGRLTEAMFAEIWGKVREILANGDPVPPSLLG